MVAYSLPSDIAEIGDHLGETARALAGRTLVLCGAGGFIGRYFAEAIDYLNQDVLEAPCRVLAVDSLITADRGAPQLSSPSYRFIRHDIRQPFDADEPVHYVVQAAGIASPYYYRAYPLETLEVATVGTKNMLELARTHGARFLFFSSSEIYGDPDPAHVPTPESYRGNVACQGPRACYDESKRLGETLTYIYHGKFGVHTNTVRPFNVYGPGMKETDFRALPNFASRIKGGKPLQVYGSGRQTRTFCYISDAMVGFLLVLLRGVAGETYNIGNTKPEISMVDLVARLERVLGRQLRWNAIEYPDTYPSDEPTRRCPDIRKARLQLGFEPKVDLDEGLRRFLSWTVRAYTGEP